MGKSGSFSLITIMILEIIGCTSPRSEEEIPVTSEEAVVRIGQITYASLHDAVEHANDGDLLVLLKDIEIGQTVEIRGKRLTLIPDGDRTIRRYPTFFKELFYIAGDGTLFLNDKTLYQQKRGRLTIDGNRSWVEEILQLKSGMTAEELEIGSLIKNEGLLAVMPSGSDNVVVVHNIILQNNMAFGHNGGAIQNEGQFEMEGGIIQNNTSNSQGGGIYNGENGIFFMWGGIIRDNRATSISAFIDEACVGGGISNHGICVIKSGEIVRNKAGGAGGGIYNDRSISIENITWGGNCAEEGRDIHDDRERIKRKYEEGPTLSDPDEMLFSPKTARV